ncbi:MAG: hypothetical protein FJ308_10685 [Planctomycetes bacterium]|nr:hypothetical protein [Planctomycetota bacterium]
MLRQAADTRAIPNRRVLEWLVISPDYEPLRSTEEFRKTLDQIDRQFQCDQLIQVAWSLARAGEHDQARATADKIVSDYLKENEPEGAKHAPMYYNLACTYSRCYESARRSGEASIPTLQSAIASFDACARLGFFNTDGIARLDADVDLNPIRETEEFKAFARSVRGK